MAEKAATIYFQLWMMKKKVVVMKAHVKPVPLYTYTTKLSEILSRFSKCTASYQQIGALQCIRSL